MLAFLLFLAAVSLCYARSEPENLLGIYFDQLGTSNCLPNALYTPTTAYVIVKNVSEEDGIAGYQFSIAATEYAFLSNVQLPSMAFNTLTFPNVMVGIGGTPLPSADVVVLMSFDIFAVSPSSLFINPLADSPYSCPMYASAAPGYPLLPLYHEYGSINVAAATIGSSFCPAPNDYRGAVSARSYSWGLFKKQYD